MPEDTPKNETQGKAEAQPNESMPKEEKDEKGIEIKELQEELSHTKDKYLRALAENENMRKRLQKEKEEAIRFAIDSTIADFLTPLDNFENALKFAESSSPEVKKWALGFEMILSQFKEVLHASGIIAFHSQGTDFDPAMHDAMEIVETKDVQDGKILEEFAKGYKTPFRIIRPARVKVAKSPKEHPANKEEKK